MDRRAWWVQSMGHRIASRYKKAFYKAFLNEYCKELEESTERKRVDSLIHIVCLFVCLFFRFFPLIGYYKIFSMASCAIELVLVGFLFYIYRSIYILLIYSSIYANSKLLSFPSPPLSLLVSISLFELLNYKISIRLSKVYVKKAIIYTVLGFYWDI